MANHKSSEKRARQTIRKNARNSETKSAVKSFEKAVLKGIEEKSKDLQTLLSAYTSKIMKAAQKGALHKKTAARKIGRLSSKVHAATTTK